jgi:peptidoglycan hydrolase-like protein with peptidoglycan-binding domain
MSTPTQPSPDRALDTAPVGFVEEPRPAVRFLAATLSTTSDPPNPNPSRIPDNLWWLWRRLRELEPGSTLGGIHAAKSGYHGTRNENRSRWPGNYSIREAEDQGGPGDKAAALDWTFPNAQRGDYSTIAKYTKRLLASGKDPNDPRLDGLREFYGQADSDRHVEGWDCRHLVDVTSEPSHLWHLHFSFDRDKVATAAGRKVMENLLSVLSGELLSGWRQRNGAAPTTPVPPPAPGSHRPGSRVLKLASPQMTGDDVRFVQRWIGPERAGVADGIYGPGTVAGVKWYQRLRGIGVDGEVGPQTWGQMGIRMGS